MSNYQDGSGYQENILSKKHVQLGFDVSLISVVRKGEQPTIYINADGVKIINLPIKKSFFLKIPYLRGMICRSTGLREKLEELNPDILFIHGVNFPETMTIVKYKHRHPNVQIYADNHLDYYNYPISSFSRWLSATTYLRFYARSLSKVCNVIWGVSPWRIEYLTEVFKIPRSKIGLLVMGGDEDYIDWDNKQNIRKAIRNQYNIPENAFVVISGGKIDLEKNIHLLEEAIYNIQVNVYCMIFGVFTDEVKELCSKFSSERIIHVGWLQSNEVYKYFISSDLAVFPGTHSVLWEQACASGLPAVFKDWDGGFNHVNVGGNCILLKDLNIDTLKMTLLRILNEKDLYQSMYRIAQTKARKIFSYLQIARQAIEL